MRASTAGYSEVGSRQEDVPTASFLDGQYSQRNRCDQHVDCEPIEALWNGPSRCARHRQAEHCHRDRRDPQRQLLKHFPPTDQGTFAFWIPAPCHDSNHGKRARSSGVPNRRSLALEFVHHEHTGKPRISATLRCALRTTSRFACLHLGAVPIRRNGASKRSAPDRLGALTNSARRPDLSSSMVSARAAARSRPSRSSLSSPSRTPS